MMGIRRVVVKPYSNDKFELVEDYTCPLVLQPKEITIKVPKGYKTNGANIPRIFWSIFPPNSPEYLSAIVVHDYLCDKEEYELADEVLREMMRELGVSKWKIWCFYYSCRLYHKVRYRR